MVNVFSRLVQMYDLYPLFFFFFCNLWYYMKLFSNFAGVHPKSPYGDLTKCASDNHSCIWRYAVYLLDSYVVGCSML